MFSFDPHRTFVVAELSANHGGSLQRALDTVGAAAKAGADGIKIQTYTPDTMTLDSSREEFIVRGGTWSGRRLYDLYREAHTPWEWHEAIQAEARRLGLVFFSTAFDPTSVHFLEQLGVPLYKVASFELTDLELLAAIGRTRKPVIMSTGMATLAEIEGAVSALRSVWGTASPGLSLLRCVSAYPASPADMNLATLPHLAAAFSAVPGLSDHTLGIAVAAASVALGARVVEKHFTLRRSDGGPDSGFSVEPQELQAMVQAIRDVELAIGQVHYGPASKAEAENTKFRRSIFIVRSVVRGEPFTRENIRVIRPSDGLDPKMLPWVLTRRAASDCDAGTPMQLPLIA